MFHLSETPARPHGPSGLRHRTALALVLAASALAQVRPSSPKFAQYWVHTSTAYSSTVE